MLPEYCTIIGAIIGSLGGFYYLYETIAGKTQPNRIKRLGTDCKYANILRPFGTILVFLYLINLTHVMRLLRKTCGEASYRGMNNGTEGRYLPRGTPKFLLWENNVKNTRTVAFYLFEKK